MDAGIGHGGWVVYCGTAHSGGNLKGRGGKTGCRGRSGERGDEREKSHFVQACFDCML